MRHSIRQWLATSDAATARWARSGARRAMRVRARRRSGSVAAHMDRVVAEANEGTRGSGLDPALERRRHRQRGTSDSDS